MENRRLALVRIRGLSHISRDIKDTLDKLHLFRKNYCSIWDPKPEILGMASKVKDYATYGFIDEGMFKLLVEKRGELYKQLETDSAEKIKKNKHSKFFVYQNKKYKKFFRLSPPMRGFGRKGIKKSFKEGGSLGYRGEAMNGLIKRMV